MKRKVLKESSELYQKILKAENCLDELGLRITYGSASDGIWLEDQETGEMFITLDKEMTFPRSIETKFYLRE